MQLQLKEKINLDAYLKGKEVDSNFVTILSSFRNVNSKADLLVFSSSDSDSSLEVKGYKLQIQSNKYILNFQKPIDASMCHVPEEYITSLKIIKKFDIFEEGPRGYKFGIFKLRKIISYKKLSMLKLMLFMSI